MSARATATPGELVRFGEPPGRWVLAVTILGSSLGFLDATVVNVALPDIGRSLHAGVSDLQWVLNGYLLTLASLILLGGTLGDRYGRRRVFSVGVVWFVAASILCAVAPSAGALIGARLLQGIGAALVTPGSLAIIQGVFEPEDRGRAIGAWSGLGGVASAIGPLVGGYLIAAISWRAIFLINVPIGIWVILAGARHVPESRDPTVSGKLDIPGPLLATLGLGGVTFALIEASAAGVAAATIAVAAAVGAAALVAFVVVERHSSHPMLPMEIFGRGQFAAANAVTFVVYGALGGVFFLLVVFLQTALGYSPIAAGAASLPVTALMLVLSARAGALAQRIGPRVPLTAGPIVLAAGMALMTGISPGDSYVGSVLPAVAVFGLGLSFVVAPVTALALAAVDARHSGAASAVNNAVARVAQLLAVALLPLVVGLSGDDFQRAGPLTGGFHTAMILTAAMAFAGGVMAWLFVRSDALEPGGGEPGEPGRAVHPSAKHHCAVAGTPLDVDAEASRPETATV